MGYEYSLREHTGLKYLVPNEKTPSVPADSVTTRNEKCDECGRQRSSYPYIGTERVLVLLQSFMEPGKNYGGKYLQKETV